MASASKGSSDKDDGIAPRRVNPPITSSSLSTVEEIPELEDFVNDAGNKDVTTANIQFIRYLQSRFEEYGNLMSLTGPSSEQESGKETTTVKGHPSRDKLPFYMPLERKESLASLVENDPFITTAERKTFLPRGKFSSFKAGPCLSWKKFQAYKSVQTEPMVAEVYQPWLTRARNSADHLCIELTNYINSLIHHPKTEKILEEKVGAVGGKDAAMTSGKAVPKKKASPFGSKLEIEVSKKLRSILTLAESLRNSIPIPLTYESDSPLGLETDDQNNEEVQRNDEKTRRLERTLANSSTQTDFAEEIASKSTGAISKRSNRISKIKESKILAAPDKPLRKSIISLPPESKPQRKSLRSLPVTSSSSSKTIASVAPESKPLRKPLRSLPTVKISSSDVEKSDKSKSANKRSLAMSQNKVKDEATKSNPVTSIRQKQAPQTKPTKSAASKPSRIQDVKKNQASSSLVAAESENASQSQEVKHRPGRVLQRKDAVNSKKNSKLRDKSNEQEWRR